MFKKIMAVLLDHPLLTTLFVVDVAILSLHKPPFIFSIIMLGALMAMCMFYGQKLSLFKD